MPRTLEEIRKMKGHGPSKVTIHVVPPRPVSEQEEHGKLVTKQRALEREKEADRILAPFFAAGEKIIAMLKPLATKYKLTGANGSLPAWMVEEVRQKMIMGLAVWAVDKMGGNFERYLEEGRLNFIDMFRVILHDPNREEFRNAKHFMEAFERADFLIPCKPGRRMVHHQEWPTLWAEYNRALEQAQEIKRRKWNNPAALRMRFKDPDVFPGIDDKLADKFCKMDSSDIAAAYVRWKFKLPVGVEALQKYFKVFHENWGYYDFIVSKLAALKQPHTRIPH